MNITAKRGGYLTTAPQWAKVIGFATLRSGRKASHVFDFREADCDSIRSGLRRTFVLDLYEPALGPTKHI